VVLGWDVCHRGGNNQRYDRGARSTSLCSVDELSNNKDAAKGLGME
jgi:hypothetical protein